MPVRDGRSSVEDLLPLLAAHKEGIAVTRKGESIGAVTATSVIAALANQGNAQTAGVTAVNESVQ